MKNNLEFVFLGGVFPKELEEEINKKSKGAMQNAANVFQWNIIKGLEEHLKKPLKLFNYMFIGSYPKRYKDFYIKKSKFRHTSGAKDINIGFLNITVFKQVIKTFAINRSLKSWLNENNKNNKIIFVYSYCFIKSLKYIKQKNSNVHICLILPDLPVFTNLDKKPVWLWQVINRLSNYNLKKALKYVDSYVLLTKNMSDFLGLQYKPFIVLEGMIDPNEFYPDIKKNYNKNKITILYAGTLTYDYGILNLIKAFIKLKEKNLELIICGEGEVKGKVEEYSRKDSRIKYLGRLTHEETLIKEREATILVNPRSEIGEYTKYSFPSKILEYLATGNLVMCYKLEGIPKEYDDYLIYIDKEKTKNDYTNLKNKLEEVTSYEYNEIIRLGNRGKRFVFNNKTYIDQTYRIIKMVFENDNVEKLY